MMMMVMVQIVKMMVRMMMTVMMTATTMMMTMQLVLVASRGRGGFDGGTVDCYSMCPYTSHN